MKISNEEYLKRTLESKKLELKNLRIEHRIAIATHKTKEEMILEQINSIENQLEK